MNEEELKLLDKIEELPKELNIEIRGLILSEVCLRKENQQLKEQLEASEKARKEAIEHIKELYDNTDDTTCYDIDKVEKERLLQILDIDKGE